MAPAFVLSNGPIRPPRIDFRAASNKENVMPKFSSARGISRSIGLAAILTAGFIAANLPAAHADPPSHAKAYGWRRKHQSIQQKSCHDGRNSRSSSRYNDRWNDDEDYRGR